LLIFQISLCAKIGNSILHPFSNEQRIANHLKDMEHSHTMESKLKAEMSVKPSALWQRRPVRMSMMVTAE
jgi:hypothetical protein